jgi:hypothetical protein
MKIELFYFDGCPNHEQTLLILQDCLKELSLEAAVERIKVESNEDAAKLRFLGSPSIRINGKDLEYDDESGMEYSMRCRIYRTGTGMQGYPPKELIMQALKSNLSEKQS